MVTVQKYGNSDNFCKIFISYTVLQQDFEDEVFRISYYLRLLKELFVTLITKPHEIIVDTFFCVCFFLHVSMQ